VGREMRENARSRHLDAGAKRKLLESNQVSLCGLPMKQNVAYRSVSLIGSPLVGILSVPPLLGAAESGADEGAKGRETPQALVATYNDAVARKDWKTCYLCCDAKWRASMLGSLFHGIAMSHDEKLKAIVKKHVG